MGLLGSLMVKLGINTTQFVSGLNSAASAANSFSKSVANNFRQTGAGSQKAGDSMNLFAKQTSNAFKDVSRIAQGIMVSQAFYQTINAIEGAIGAVSDFSSKCEDARASFGLLMKDQAKAGRFMTVLENFAADTPYTFEQAAQNARRLLAFGFDVGNIKPVMETLSDAAAASGDAEAFNRIGKALGQIHTKGRLASQELLQLTEAGIPAFEILREKLGLTADEMGKIGNLKIPADIAINAILSGMQDRYGGAAQVMSNTVSGMLSTIKDNALIIGKEAASPLYESFKTSIRKIRDLTDRLRESVRAGGIGGMMREIIPPDLLPAVQQIVAGIQSLARSFGILYQALQPITSALREVFLNLIVAILPFITAFAQILSVLAYWLTSNGQAVRYFVVAITSLFIASKVTTIILGFGAAVRSLFIVKLIAQLVIGLAQAVRILAVAMVSNPWIAMIGIAAGALLYLGTTSQKVKGWISGVGAGINKAFGVNPSKVFTPKVKESTGVADEFNQKLTVSKESLDKMGDSAKKAGKKAKEALMSFDEVFNLKDPDEGADGLEDAADMGDIGEVGSIPDVGMPDLEFPETDTPIQNWVDEIKNNIIDKLKSTLAGAGIGAAIGAIFGGLLGGPGGAIIGAKIGALAGGIVGFFWDQLSDQIKNDIKGAGVGAGIGAVIGGLLGGPGGAAIGAGIGAVVGGVVTHFWEQIEQFFMSSTGQAAGVGAGVGGAIGFALGGPLGAGIGAALGAAIGTLVGTFWDDIVKYFTSDTGKATTAGTLIGGGVGFLVAGPIGAALGAIIGGIIGASWKDIQAWWSGVSEGFSNWCTETGEKLSTWWTDTKTGFNDWSVAVGNTYATWWADVKTGFNNWCTEVGNNISTWWADTKVGFATWCSEVGNSVSTWWSDTKTGFANWTSEVKTGVSGWWADTKAGFSEWSSNTGSTISTWWGNTKTGFGGWWNDVRTGFNTWKSNVGSSFGEWSSNTLSTIGSWGKNAGQNFSTWISGTKGNFGTWWSDVKSGFSSWSSGAGGSISSWYNSTYSVLSGWWSNTKGSFSSWWSDSKAGFSDWASGIYESVLGWFDRLGEKLRNFFDKLAFWKKKAGEEGSSSDSSDYGGGGSLRGHAKGGVFNREHIARFAEGNKAEAIIPLEDGGAMAPFVSAVADGLTSSLGAIVSQVGQISAMGSAQPVDDRPILYVGTLIADDRGLRELERKMQVIRAGETRRRL